MSASTSTPPAEAEGHAVSKREGQRVARAVTAAPQPEDGAVVTELRRLLREWEACRLGPPGPVRARQHDRLASLLHSVCAWNRIGWFDSDGFRYAPSGDASFTRSRLVAAPKGRRAITRISPACASAVPQSRP